MKVSKENEGLKTLISNLFLTERKSSSFPLSSSTISFDNFTFGGIDNNWVLTYGVDSFVGRSIDDFHENPAHQRKILSNNKNFPINAGINIGPLTLDLNIERVADDKGKTQGFVVNWAAFLKATTTNSFIRSRVIT